MIKQIATKNKLSAILKIYSKTKSICMNINKVMIYGNLTRDPEIRQLPSGTNVANLGIATNRYYNNQQGEKVEEVEYHNIVLFGRLADLAQQYLNKGSGAYIEGRLRTSSWDDKETGQKRYRTEIVGEQMQFGPRRDNAMSDQGGNQQGAPQQAKTPPSATQPAQQGQAKTPDYPEATINPDDIPF